MSPGWIAPRRARGLGLLLLAQAAGCGGLPQPAELIEMPAPHLAATAPAGIDDQRARFRNIFCMAFERDRARGRAAGDCAEWLWRLADEPVTGSEPPPPTTRSLQVFLVAGAFSECFGAEARPFVAAIPTLVAQGHRIETIEVGGRSGTEQNARQIAEYLSSHAPAGSLPTVMIGYSKGINDVLEFLVGFPEVAARVDAVVSLAGTVAGSALAGRTAGLYDLLLANWPDADCPPGDGAVIDSLRRDVRRTWLERHSLPDHVRYFSIAAFATRERTARALVPAWRWLLRHDRRNDSQLLPRDALVPNSILLGYLHADHWAVALEVERRFDTLAARPDARPFPRTALLEAILLHVASSLPRAGRQQA